MHGLHQFPFQQRDLSKANDKKKNFSDKRDIYYPN